MGNVAHQLYYILNEIEQSQNIETYEALGEIFKIPSSDKASILLSYGNLFAMINEIKTKLEDLPYISNEKYLKALANATEALTKVSFANPSTITNYQNYITEATLERIDSCGDLLKQATGEFELERESLDELQQEVENLIDYVAESTINMNLKTLVLNCLGDIKKSIHDYQFKGTKGIKDALDASAGAMILSTSGAETEEERHIFKSVFELISKFNQLVLFGRNVGAIVSPLINLWLDNK